MLKKYTMIVAVLTLAVLSVAAAQYHKDEFAFGYLIEVDGAGAVYSVPVPYEVYADTVQVNLADVRVFNAEGEVVPHHFRYAEIRDEAHRDRVNIPFYPLSSEETAPADDLSVEVRRSDSGEVVHIETRSGPPREPVRSYIFDVKNAGPYPITLRLDWDSKGTGTLLPITLDGSHDLVHWQRVTESVLADLRFMGNNLRHGEVKLRTEPPRYLRLKIGPGGAAVRITDVNALTEPQRANMERNWVDLPLQRHEEAGEVVLRGELPGSFPADGLQLTFARPNSILQARIHTRDRNEPWHFRADYLFYELLEGGVKLKNDPLIIQRENVSSFKLEVIEDGTGSGSEPLELQVGYVPHELIFIARGSGPFVLAYGNGRMDTAGPGKSRAGFHGLKGEENKSLVRAADLKGKTVLGGEEMLERATEPPWRKIVLWLVLLLGVVALALMVWSLTRKMKDT